MRLPCWTLHLAMVTACVSQALQQKEHGDILGILDKEGFSEILGSSRTCATIFITDEESTSTTFRKASEAIADGSGIAIFQLQTSNLGHNGTQDILRDFVGKMTLLRKTSPCLTLIMASSDLLFLDEISRHVDEGRLLLWETKVLALSKLSLRNLSTLMESNWVFSMTNTMVSNLESRSGSIGYGLYSYFPYSGNGKGKAVRIGSWSEEVGLTLLSNLPLYPQKYFDFHGAEVGMTVWPFMPYFMAREEPVTDGTGGGSGHSNYTGRDYIMLETMTRFLNITIKFIPTESWDEVILLVKQRISFMSPMKLAIMPHLLKELDFTVSIEPATLTFSMAKPTLKPRWQSLYYPLTDQVWAFILAMMVLMPAVFTMFSWLRHHSGNISPSTIVLRVFGTLLGQNFHSQFFAGSSGRFLMGMWLLFAFIVSTAYRGNLTAHLTIPKYPPRVETLPELLERNAKVMMPSDTVDFYNNFKESPSSEFRTLSERVTFVDSFQEGLSQAEITNSAYMYERRFMELMIARHFTPLQSSSQLYVARQNVWPGYSAWPVIRDAPFKPVVDRCIQAFNEAGLVDKWGDMVVEEARRISRKKRLLQIKGGEEKAMGEDLSYESNDIGEAGAKGKDDPSQALTVTHMQGPLMLLLLGLAIAALIFGIEFCTRTYY